MAQWPLSLPQKPETNGYRKTPLTRVVTQPMESGPPKTRRRSTKRRFRWSAQYLVDYSQSETLEDFHENTLGGGADSFDWPEPETGDLISVIFSHGEGSPLQFKAVGGDLYVATITVETA